MTKYGNTLKLMGVSGKDSMIFDDYLSIYHLAVNREVKETALNYMLNTKIMDKTLIEWIKYFENIIDFKIYDPYTQTYSKPKTIFTIDYIHTFTIKGFIQEILQVYYKKQNYFK
jgi:hypothetical protein